MWVGIEVLDRTAFIPAWTLCVTFGVLIGWVRWRSPWRKR